MVTRPTKTLLLVAALGVLLAAVPTTPTADDSRTYEQSRSSPRRTQTYSLTGAPR